MAHQEFDKSSKWMIQKHGDGILFLAGIKEKPRWKAVQSELVQPGQLPDGLIEAHFKGQKTADYFLVEIASRREKRILRQVLRDMMLGYQHLGKLPELITVVLSSKGQIQIPGNHRLESRLKLASISFTWTVVNLWEVPAEDLLAANDVGLIPWVPLSKFDGPPEPMLKMCRERIEQQAPYKERDNLLAVSQILSRLRYNDPSLRELLGGRKAMIESPLIRELIVENTQENIRTFLQGRFKEVPQEIFDHLNRIQSPKKLKPLVEFAASCKDLKAFRAKLLSL
jgi:hypothetical protein